MDSLNIYESESEDENIAGPTRTSGKSADQSKMKDFFVNYIKNNKAQDENKEDFEAFAEVNYIEDKDERIKKLSDIVRLTNGPACMTLNKQYIILMLFYEKYKDQRLFQSELKEALKIQQKSINYSKFFKTAQFFYFIHKFCVKNSWKSAKIPPSYLRNIDNNNREAISLELLK
jgi:hypothetical protein